jgi:hypothetical protein
MKENKATNLLAMLIWQDKFSSLWILLTTCLGFQYRTLATKLNGYIQNWWKTMKSWLYPTCHITTY